MKIKDIGKIILKIVLTVLLLLTVTFIALFIHHTVTKRSVEEYLPPDAQAYIEIESLKELYDDVIDLKALEIIFSHEKLNAFFYSFIDFKNAEFSDSFLFKELLKLRAFIVLQDNYSPTIIVDPGAKGIITRHIPAVLTHIKNEDLQVTTSTLEGESLITVTLKEETNYYIVLQENLIIIALDKKDLLPILKAKKDGLGVKTKEKLKSLKSTKVKNSILNIFLDTDSALETVSTEDSPAEKILSLVDFPSLTSLSLALTNDEINIRATTDINTENSELKSFLSHKASPLGIIKNLPDSTNIYTSVNFKSFEELYSIITLIQDDFTLKEYDLLIKSISGLTSDDILFSWTGSEAGLFSIETAPEPVLFLEISDNSELDRVLDSINSSLALNISNSLVIDDIRINQFKLPVLLDAGVSIAKKNSTLPYFIRHNNYLFLSMNPEILAQVVIKERNNELLIKEKTYKSITDKTPKNANFFFYYDLNSTMPRFLTKENLLTDLIKEYEKGVISLFYKENRIRLNLSAETSTSNRTTLFPGYPKKTKGVKSPLIAADIKGKESYELIYIDNKNNLVISDISNNILSETPIGEDSYITLTNNKKLLVNDSNGMIYRVTSDGETEEGFPVYTDAVDSFPPLRVKDGILLYSKSRKEIQHFNFEGEVIKSFEVEKDIFSTPLLDSDRLFFYPKSLFGKIFGTDLDGNIIGDWPQSTMGISYSTPFKAGNKVGFLTQKGDLFLWNKNGKIEENFPISLNGVFYSTPVSINEKGSLIAVINKDGVLSIVNSSGELLQTRTLENVRGKDIGLIIKKIPGFKSPVLFVYGGSNYITALNNNLQILPGFPIKGYTEPFFADINDDGFTEIISAGYDKKIYIYTLRNKQ